MQFSHKKLQFSLNFFCSAIQIHTFELEINNYKS